MFNLFDILQSQAGPGMQSIGQQFGLSPDQSRRAMEALLPALATGLQRSAATDPTGFGRLLGLAQPAAPFGAPAPNAQRDILSQLFGSPMLAQAVLQQASLASGIGTQALRQMLPVMAGMVVAGIVHMLLNQQPPAASPAPPPPAPRPEPGFPVATFWNDWLNGFLGAAGPRPEPEATARKAADKPPESKPREPVASRPAPAPVEPARSGPTEAPATPEPPQPAAGDGAPFEAFQEMFRSGVQAHEQNARAMQEIFDAFWSPPPETPDATTEPSPAPERPAPASTSSRRAAGRPGLKADAGTKRTPRRK